MHKGICIFDMQASIEDAWQACLSEDVQVNQGLNDRSEMSLDNGTANLTDSSGSLTRDIIAQIDAWAERQLGSWMNVKKGEKALATYHRLARHSIFHFQIMDNKVVCLEKSASPPGSRQRMAYYLAHIEAVLGSYRIPDCSFLIDVDDCPLDNPTTPVFTFQKLQHQHNILLPDVDFLGSHYYADRHWGLPDRRSFLEKRPVAFFAGATTGGGEIEHADLLAGRVPRVEAARAFRNCADVDFRLPKIVQCSDDARTSLEKEGFGVGKISWPDQLDYRFLITMDGNGAACSRLYVALMSNSVPLKFRSNSELYYFDGLRPNEHYVDIPDHERVIEVVRSEQASPGCFASIAEEGRRFAAEYLTRAAVEYYTGRVLSFYASGT